MGHFDGTATADVFERGEYFEPGTYNVEIARCLVKDSQNSGMGFIVETEVLTSNHPDTPPGSKRTWWQGMGRKKIADVSLKGFMLAAFGVDFSSDYYTEKFSPRVPKALEYAVSEANPLCGQRIHLVVTKIRTKPTPTEPTGHDFNRHDWSKHEAPGVTFDDYMARATGGNNVQTPGPVISPDGQWKLVAGQWVANR